MFRRLTRFLAVVALAGMGMAGDTLPYDYEVEYLQGTGIGSNPGAYLYFPDIHLTSDDTITAEVTLTESTTDWSQCMWCSRREATTSYPSFTLFKLSTGNVFRFDYNLSANTTTYSPVPMRKMTIKAEKNVFKVDGTTVFTATYASGKQGLHGLSIFASYAGNATAVTSWNNYGNYKLHSFKVERGGEAILDLIPVAKSYIGYMYDRVSGKMIGNAGTGRFLVGPRVIPPEKLPYNCEVEYLLATGTQWIDTGINVTGKDIIGIDCQFADLTVQRRLFGTSGGSPCIQIYINGSSKWASAHVNSATGDWLSSNVAVNRSRHTFIMDGVANKLYIDGTAYTTLKAVTTTNPNTFRVMKSDNSSLSMYGYIYRFWVIRNGETIMDLIPVRVRDYATGTDVGYMYDKISGRLLGNAGTGTFGIGPDQYVPKPEDVAITSLGGIDSRSYVASGLMDMWDGIDNVGVGRHDSSSTTWKNLAGGVDAILTGVGSFDDNSLVCAGGERTDSMTIPGAVAQTAAYGAETKTVEVAFKLTSKWGYEHTNQTKGPQFVLGLRRGSDSYRRGSIGFPNQSTSNYSVFTVNPGGSTASAIRMSSGNFLNRACSVSFYDPNGLASTANQPSELYINGITESYIAGGIGCNGRVSSTWGTGFGGHAGSLNTGWYAMSGHIYCVRIYNRKLSEEERLHNWKVDKVRFGITD